MSNKGFRHWEDGGAENLIVSIFTGVAALMLFIAGISTFFNIQKISRERSADGRVIEVVKQRKYINEADRVYEDFYYPVVRFTASDGRTREIQLNEGSNFPIYESGEQVTILYDSAHPLDARIKSASSNMLMWILPGITGILGLAFGGAVFVVNKFLFSKN